MNELCDYHRVHTKKPMKVILSHINPIYILPRQHYVFKAHLSINFPPTLYGYSVKYPVEEIKSNTIATAGLTAQI